MLKFVYIDGMNVLLHRKHPESYYFEKEIGLPADQYEQTIYEVVEKQSAEMKNEFWTLSTLDQEIDYMNRYNTLLCEHLNITPTPELIAKLTSYRVYGDYELAPNAKEILAKLSKVVKIGILSNAMPSRRFHELKLQNIDQYFDTIILSREVGFFKPAKEIYEIAQNKSGCMAGEIMFVDDKAKYLDGAKQIGWDKLYLYGDAQSENYTTLTSFEDLEYVVEQFLKSKS